MKLIGTFLYHLFMLLPLKRKTIFFESYIGLSYSCNPKYMYEELLNTKLNYQAVWSVQDKSTVIPGKPTLVSRFSFFYYYYLATSKYLVSNTEFAQNLPVRRNQVYLNTQHGSPIKLMGKHKISDIPNRRPKTKRWSYLLSQNDYSAKIFADAYMYDGTILRCGYPRNVIFFSTPTIKKIRQRMRQTLKIPPQAKAILYAPTWREGKQIQDLNFDRLSSLSNEIIYFLVRSHHLDKIRTSERASHNVNIVPIDCTGANFDIQELSITSDLLITDYSSILFDYIHLNKPIILHAPDYELYTNVDRGLYFDLQSEAPGPVTKTNEQLANELKLYFLDPNYSELHSKTREEFKIRYPSYDNTSSASEALKALLQ